MINLFRAPVALLALLCLSLSCLSGCVLFHRDSSGESRRHAFIAYWPEARQSGRLTVAIKDNIDLQGVVTTDGSQYLARTNPPALADAACLKIMRERHVGIVGKTNLSEFTAEPSGFNSFFGTPRNPLDRRSKIIPGGSSSGSAVAVADGLVDVSFGTDTAGSVRVPAACSGVVGLKTTFGLVSLKGVVPVEPDHLDTVGPIAKDIAGTVEGMDLLVDGFKRQYERAVAARPSGKRIRVGRLYLAGTDPRIDRAIDLALQEANFQVIKLPVSLRGKWERAQQDGNIVAAAGTWKSASQYAAKPFVTALTRAILAVGHLQYLGGYPGALKRQAGWQQTLARTFRHVDFIALPTLQTLPPEIPFFGVSIIFEGQVLGLQNTSAVNFAGNPALAMPIPVEDKRVALTSLQLVGPRLSEAALLNAGRLIEIRASSN
jgi:amidase